MGSSTLAQERSLLEFNPKTISCHCSSKEEEKHGLWRRPRNAGVAIGGGGDDYRKGGGIHVLQAGGHMCVTGTKHGSKSQPIFSWQGPDQWCVRWGELSIPVMKEKGLLQACPLPIPYTWCLACSIEPPTLRIKARVTNILLLHCAMAGAFFFLSLPPEKKRRLQMCNWFLYWFLHTLQSPDPLAHPSNSCYSSCVVHQILGSRTTSLSLSLFSQHVHVTTALLL